LTYEERLVESLCPFRRNFRSRYQKTTLKSISFGLEKEPAAYLVKVLMELLFQPSVLPQVYRAKIVVAIQKIKNMLLMAWLLYSYTHR
jgi:hypothetical protein